LAWFIRSMKGAKPGSWNPPNARDAIWAMPVYGRHTALHCASRIVRREPTAGVTPKTCRWQSFVMRLFLAADWNKSMPCGFFAQKWVPQPQWCSKLLTPGDVVGVEVVHGCQRLRRGTRLLPGVVRGGARLRHPPPLLHPTQPCQNHWRLTLASTLAASEPSEPMQGQCRGNPVQE